MITATATQLVRRGKEAELENLMKDLIMKVKGNEPGRAMFEYFRSADRERTYLVVEQYVDKQALNYHRSTEYLKQFVQKMLECLEQPPDVTSYEDVFPDLRNTAKGN